MIWYDMSYNKYNTIMPRWLYSMLNKEQFQSKEEEIYHVFKQTDLSIFD